MSGRREISGTEAEGGFCPKKFNNGDKDHISKLPDDVLHTILSLLNMRDAVRTSVLSRRWKNMHAYISNIEFNWLDIMAMPIHKTYRTVCRRNEHYLRKRIEQYFLDKIGRFLACHLGAKVDSFKVSCCFGSSHALQINDWISFAVRKGVEKLDFAFTFDKLAERTDWRTIDYYHFPTQLLLHGAESKLRHLSLRSCTLQSDFNDRFRTLSTLVLCDVNLAGRVEPSLFSSCLCLEYLTLQWCFGLEWLCFGISLRHLKVLVVSLCEGLKGIDLSAINLTSFRYKGDPIDLNFESVPNLEEVYVMMKEINVIPIFAQLEKDLPHVKTMTVSKIHQVWAD